MTIGRRLGLLTALILAISVVVGVVGVLSLASVDRNAAALFSSGVKPIDALGRLHDGIGDDRYWVWDYTDAGAKDRAEIKASIAETDQAIDEHAAAFVASSSDGGRRALLAEWQGLWVKWKAVRDQVVLAKADAGDVAGAHEAITGVLNEAYDAYAVPLDKLVEDENAAAADQAAEAARTDANASRLLALLLVCGIGLGIGLGVIFARSITRPLVKAVEVLRAVAHKDFTATLDGHRDDELGEMADALNSATAQIRDTLTQLAQTSTRLYAGSEQLTGVAAVLQTDALEASSEAVTVAAAAEEVSRNIETVAYGTQELSRAAREIAENASDAANAAVGAASTTEDAARTVKHLVEAASAISDITTVVQTIADQTGLLALNATIEAARAGDAGRGFAVVAAEVKQLAGETSRATSEIAERIAVIQRNVVDVTKVMSDIGSAVASINNTQTTIAAAVEEQTATTADIARNSTQAATVSSGIATSITGVAVIAERTTAGAQAAHAAAANMAQMASELNHILDAFTY